MNKLKLISVICSLIFMVGCGESEAEKMIRQQQTNHQPSIVQNTGQVQPNVQSNGQPQVIVVQQPQQSSGMGDMLTGAAIGAMATQIFNNSSRPAVVPSAAPRVIERTRIVERSAPPVVPATIEKTKPPTVAPTPSPVYTPRQFSGSSIGRRSSSFSSSRSGGRR